MSKSPKTVLLPEQGLENHSESKIEAVKNLIFGETIQNYNAEFEGLKKDLQNKKKTLEALIDEVHAELRTAIDNLGTDLNIRISDLEKSLEARMDDLDGAKVDKQALGNLLIGLGERIAEKKG